MTIKIMTGFLSARNFSSLCRQPRHLLPSKESQSKRKRKRIHPLKKNLLNKLLLKIRKRSSRWLR